VGVKALETARSGLRAPDAKAELGPEGALFLVAALQRGGQLGVVGSRSRPPFNPARRLETGDSDDEVRTREPERGREWRSRVVVGILLGDRREPERTADSNPAEGARLAA
jgi:hypothetical protein